VEVDVEAIADIFYSGRKVDRSVGELFADHAIKTPAISLPSITLHRTTLVRF
jgi:hypothetical protein